MLNKEFVLTIQTKQVRCMQQLQRIVVVHRAQPSVDIFNDAPKGFSSGVGQCNFVTPRNKGK